MESEWKVFPTFAVIVGLSALAGCGRPSATPTSKLPSFSISNEVVKGQQRQVIEVANGLSLYFSDSNLVVWFCKGSDIIIEFDPQTVKPSSIMLEMPASDQEPAQSVWDLNADGVPEMRQIKGHSTNEILFQGEWYEKRVEGTNLVISVSGREIAVRYNGRRWVEAND